MFNPDKLVAKNKIRHDYSKVLLNHGLVSIKAAGGDDAELVKSASESNLADLLELADDLAIRLVVRTPENSPKQRLLEYQLVHADDESTAQPLQTVRSGKEFSANV